MQPFDALSLKTIIEEVRPLLLNRKVDKVYQLGRDEVILTLRSHDNVTSLFLSAHAMLGRISVVDSRNKRYEQPPKAKGSTAQNHGQSAFSMILRKNLTGGTLLAIEFQDGERMADFIFSCVDEVGTRSHKVLTAEIMGRHSNLIFWDKSAEKILASSHVVTEEMSKLREIAAGLRFVRPPMQPNSNIFKISKSEFEETLANQSSVIEKNNLSKWLINTFSGIGKNLAEEMVIGLNEVEVDLEEKLFERVQLLQARDPRAESAMRLDLSKYSVLNLLPIAENQSLWQSFDNANNMIATYFESVEEKEKLRQFREKLKAELSTGIEKLESRKRAANEQLLKAGNPDALKKAGDLILANLHAIVPGQEVLRCEDYFCDDENKLDRSIEIALDPNLTGTQNSQNYYRLFNKHKIRYAAANAAIAQADERLKKLLLQLNRVEQAIDIAELTLLKEHIVEQKPEFKKPPPTDARKKNKSKLIQLRSSDGWIIYIGRNRFENDQLLSKLAQPSDVWLHVLGSGGAHVLVKVPASKQNPPLTTLKEAAEVAARMSKASSGAKVRVVYTQIRYVKKLANEKPGVVRYENEKTLEIDTSLPVPPFMRVLFPA